MKCQYCNIEIPDDAVFCPECGQRQTASTPMPSPTPVAEPKSVSKMDGCPVCGTPIENDASFCPECGTPYAQSKPIPPTIPARQKKNRAPFIIIGIVSAVVLITALIAAVLLFSGKKDSKTDPAVQDTQNTSETSEEELLSDVDFNLLEEDCLYMEGLIKKTESGESILRWENEYTFYGEDFDGTKILLEDARNAYIDEAALSDGMIDSIKSNQTVTIDGQLYFDNEKLYITPFIILDENGNDLIETFEENQTKQLEEEMEEKNKSEAINNDYILPQSSSRLLTDSDISGLDLREINYAKNEIYARHGRLFDSAELQNYFNSKNWYHGTIAADTFSNALLSDVEQKNAEFLSTIEFNMNPDGYQLDAN